MIHPAFIMSLCLTASQKSLTASPCGRLYAFAVASEPSSLTTMPAKGADQISAPHVARQNQEKGTEGG